MADRKNAGTGLFSAWYGASALSGMEFVELLAYSLNPSDIVSIDFFEQAKPIVRWQD
jgi:hypothetical protein